MLDTSEIRNHNIVLLSPFLMTLIAFFIVKQNVQHDKDGSHWCINAGSENGP